MNIVFMGTPDFAVESLRKIYESGHHIKAVVTNPDKPAGRNMKCLPTPVKEYAESKGIKVYQTERIKKDEALIATIKELKPDVIVVVAFGQILPESVLKIPKYGAVNVHGSLLPKYRGAAPIQWAVINGDKVTGITTMYMDAGMDTGDIIDKQEVVIDAHDTYGSLYEKMKIVGGNMIVKTLDKIAEGIATRTKQPEGFSMAPMIEKEMGKINWNDSAEKINDLVRGFNPTPGAYTSYHGEKLKIWEAEVINEEVAFAPGSVIHADSKSGILVATGKGCLKLIELQLPNSKKMLAKDFLNGHNISGEFDY